MKTIWGWVMAFLGWLFGRNRPGADDDHFLSVADLVRSANICLASHGATKRERANAKAKLQFYQGG